MLPVSNARTRLPTLAVALAGLVLLAWGVASIVLPVHYVTTVRPLDAVLVAVAAYLWVPALGLLLVSVAATPALHARTGRSTPWAVAVGALGLVLVAFGLFLTAVTLNRLLGAIYVSPITLAGVLFVGVALHSRVRRSTGRAPGGA